MTSMFDQSNANNEQNPQEKTAEELLASLVGEGKKYATAQDLAKAYSFADAHIKKVENENNDLRVKTEAAKSVDEILAGLKAQSTQQQSTEDTQAPDQSQESNDTVDIEKLLEQKLNERDNQSRATTNKKQVTDALIAKFGNRAGEVFDAKAKEMGIDLESLASQAPQLVLQSFGVGSSPASSSAQSPVGDTRGNAPDGVTAEAGTKAYFQQMRASGKMNRSEYYASMHKALSDDPSKFNS